MYKEVFSGLTKLTTVFLNENTCIQGNYFISESYSLLFQNLEIKCVPQKNEEIKRKLSKKNLASCKTLWRRNKMLQIELTNVKQSLTEFQQKVV